MCYKIIIRSSASVMRLKKRKPGRLSQLDSESILTTNVWILRHSKNCPQKKSIHVASATNSDTMEKT